MHCPNCGTRIETDEVSYCSRCGLTLGAVRALMLTGTSTDTHVSVSLGSLNLGVVLMFVGVILPLFAVLTSPIALPAAFALLTLELIAILLGSGNLLRFFQPENTPDEVIRLRRKEVAFGSALMYVGAVLATFAVAAIVPDSWIKASLTSAILGIFILFLLSSKWIFNSIRSPLATRSNEFPAYRSSAEISCDGFGTGDLGRSSLLFETSDLRELELTERPPSVTEGTTRHLKAGQ